MRCIIYFKFSKEQKDYLIKRTKNKFLSYDDKYREISERHCFIDCVPVIGDDISYTLEYCDLFFRIEGVVSKRLLSYFDTQRDNHESFYMIWIDVKDLECITDMEALANENN